MDQHKPLNDLLANYKALENVTSVLKRVINYEQHLKSLAKLESDQALWLLAKEAVDAKGKSSLKEMAELLPLLNDTIPEKFV